MKCPTCNQELPAPVIVPPPDPDEDCIRFHGHDKGDIILSCGNLENSVGVLAYNALSYYQHDIKEEPSAGWFIEPNYCRKPNERWMELYGQYQKIHNDQKSVRRPFMSAFDVEAGQIVATELSAGPSGYVAIAINNGSNDGNMTGVHKLVVTNDRTDIHNTLFVNGINIIDLIERTVRLMGR